MLQLVLPHSDFVLHQLECGLQTFQNLLLDFLHVLFFLIYECIVANFVASVADVVPLMVSYS